MKKIILIALGCFILYSVEAQNASQTTESKAMSVSEANRLNGTAEPTINGKPYSVYKAEQNALKAQQANRMITRTAGVDPMNSTVSSGQNKPAVQQGNILKGDETKEPAPVIKPAPVVAKQEVITEAPVVDLGSGNVNPASANLKQQPVVLPAEIRQSRTPSEIDAARKAEALQVQKKPVVEEKVIRTEPNPLLTGAATSTGKTTVAADPEKLKPVTGAGNTPVQEKKD
jgi:hypothetical protein